LDKLALLFKYQQADAELEAYEKKLKNTPTRKQLLKLQNFLKKQQAALKEMENKALVEQNALFDIETQYGRMIELLSKKHKDIGEYEKMEYDEMDTNVVRDLVHEYETTYENIIKQKKRALSVNHKAEETEARLKEILPRVSKAQKDFARLKRQHEEELRAGAAELEKLKKAAEAAALEVDCALIERYNAIKQNKPMPVSQLKDGRCTGCNMELPSRDLAKMKKSGAVIECENCGRILYVI